MTYNVLSFQNLLYLTCFGFFFGARYFFSFLSIYLLVAVINVGSVQTVKVVALVWLIFVLFCCFFDLMIKGFAGDFC